MPGLLKAYTLKPSQGGRLATDVSLENVGEPNYSAKRNWRRSSRDQESIREGDIYFRPNTSLPQGTQALNSESPIQQFAEVRRPNGDRSVLALTASTIYRYVFSTGTWQMIGSGFSATAQRWQTRELNGYLILNNGVDLPMTFRHEDSAVKPIYEMRENGIAAVGCICVFNGFLVYADVTEIQASELAGVMNGSNPYGPVSAGIVNRIRFKIGWSEFGEPRRHAPVIPAVIENIGKTATMAFPVHADTMAANSMIAVIGAYMNGGVLGGQEGAEEGLKVVSLAGTEITWDLLDSDADLDYPLAVSITRWSDVSTMVGSSSIQDDSSGILNIEPLGNNLCVYRDTGMFTGRYTGNVDTPFIFKSVYRGKNTLYYRWSLIDIGDAHLFAGSNMFFIYDAAGEPRPAEALNLAKKFFFTSLSVTQTHSVWSARNPITKEVWFGTPNGVLAWDWVYDTVSEIDVAYTAALAVTRPLAAQGEAPEELWFIMAATESGAGKVLQYGRTNEGFVTVKRRGSSYSCVLRSGLWSVGDEFQIKDIRAFILQLATESSDASIYFRLLSTNDSWKAPTLLTDYTFEVSANDGRHLLPLLYRDVFFQDEITVTTAVDSMVSVSSRTIEVARVLNRGR